MLDHGHKTFFKEFGNCIIKIGGLHAEMNMLRSYVSLTWKICYGFLSKAIGFLSPKAQLVMSKVTDLHKGWDAFIAQRNAVIREVVKAFLEFARKKGIKANSDTFEEWEKNEVKNENYEKTLEGDKAETNDKDDTKWKKIMKTKICALAEDFTVCTAGHSYVLLVMCTVYSQTL